jgi:hypothetical protein
METNIIVKLNFAALHNWPDCNIKEVDYLKYPHRHTFFITCKKAVSHNDRDIEIIMLKNSISNHLYKNYAKGFGSMSCEMIAEMLLKAFDLNYCQVLEDNENGAEIKIS